MDTVRQQGSYRVRVCIADATRMSAQLIAVALKRYHKKLDICAFAGNSSEVFSELRTSRPDIAVISAQLEDGRLAGFKVVDQLLASNSKIRSVMLLDSDERDLVVDAFRAGARGVFCRGSSFNALPKCIRRVYEGQIWISNAELEFLLGAIVNLRRFHIHKGNGNVSFTPRERDVIRLVAEGMRNQEIGVALSLREHTVRNYIFRVFEKLGLSSRVELVLYALKAEQSFGDQSSRDAAERTAPDIAVAR
ncbi:MAG: hypothetical protein DMG38_04305 [Acidobacteria bacterium]|nr:MAG: hypothetical protein DMG38_04305 [Acidobacteriota bacterium]